MRVLFLDFDGVLHPLGLQLEAGRYVNGKPVAKPVAVEFFCWLGLLGELLKGHEDVRLVVHSSWRESHTEEALVAYFADLKHLVLGATRADLPKYESVLAWVAEHPEVRGYRILDDALQEFPQDPAVDEFIACHWQRGITEAEVQTQLRDWLAATR